MTNLLDSVQTGAPPQQYGTRTVIAGLEKSGKTTLACDAPNSLLIPMEMGFASITTPRLPNLVTTWAEVIGICEELRARAMTGRLARGASNVWDSATALERIIHQEVIDTDPGVIKARMAKVKNPTEGVTLESAHGGFGKAYSIANDMFFRWAGYADELAFKGGINTIVTCHVFPAKVIDPAHGEYDTWDLQLHSPKNQKTYGKREFITQWADLIGFLHEPMFVYSAGKGETLNKAVSQGAGRVLAVDRTPSWVAGNRYGLSGIIPIPPENGWNKIALAIYNQKGLDYFNRAHAQP